MMTVYINLTDRLVGILSGWGMEQKSASLAGQLVMLGLLVIIAYTAYRVAWYLMRKLIIPLIQKSKTKFDDLLLKHYFFRKISFLVPALILYYYLNDVLYLMPGLTRFLITLINIFFVFITILIIDSILSTVNDYYERFEIAKDHPIKSVIQIIKIIVYFIGLLVVIGILFERDLSSLLISLGTLSAVLMLIFRDPILGFVGGLQLVFNKMIKIGDWITVPHFGADGTVLEITLTTVKIQNFDKTIVTVPTYSLISGSFQNWRGMEESGGRRIKRSVYIDMDSVAFVDDKMLEKFMKIKVLRPYLEQKQKEIEEYNKNMGIDPSVKVNGRRQTNLGVFRAYLKAYLRNRPDIHQNMTFLVRQLQPAEKGIPIQIYVFTKTTEWVEYENIQADIFDHILSVIPEFGLRVYQFPKSGDIQSLLKTAKTQ
jgi:miniconductance mechanosensitive channel